MSKGTIVAVGMFDGVHRGHRFILERLVSLAHKLDLEPAVVTFANHPLSVIAPDRQPGLLSDTATRVGHIEQCGISNIRILTFDDALRGLIATEFAHKFLKTELNARAVLLGHDNGFGSERLRSVEAYRTALQPLGIDVYACEALPGQTVINSTAVRNAVSSGDMHRAEELLGRPYMLSGKVVRGKHLGTTIGFPTANIATGSLLLPRPGVYRGTVVEPARAAGLPAMINIGTAPTVNDGNDIVVEVHIISDQPLGDMYGEKVSVTVSERLRDERRFASVAELQQALAADRQRILRQCTMHNE